MSAIPPQLLQDTFTSNPFVELALRAAYLANFQPVVTNAATLALMGVNTVGVVQSHLAATMLLMSAH